MIPPRSSSSSKPTKIPLVALATLLPHNAKSRVVFCAKEGHSSEFQNQLVKRLRVTAILHHPVDPDELVRRASIELDTKVPTLETRVSASQAIPKALLPVWQRHQETNRERVEVLVTVASEETPSEEWLDAGRRAAHQLAGSLGTFGLATASLLARDAETLITQFATLSPDQRDRLDKVIHALQLQIADPQLKLPDLEHEAPKGSILIFSIDSEWAKNSPKRPPRPVTVPCSPTIRAAPAEYSPWNSRTKWCWIWATWGRMA